MIHSMEFHLSHTVIIHLLGSMVVHLTFSVVVLICSMVTQLALAVVIEVSSGTMIHVSHGTIIQVSNGVVIQLPHGMLIEVSHDLVIQPSHCVVVQLIHSMKVYPRYVIIHLFCNMVNYLFHNPSVSRVDGYPASPYVSPSVPDIYYDVPRVGGYAVSQYGGPAFARDEGTSSAVLWHLPGHTWLRTSALMWILTNQLMWESGLFPLPSILPQGIPQTWVLMCLPTYTSPLPKNNVPCPPAGEGVPRPPTPLLMWCWRRHFISQPVKLLEFLQSPFPHLLYIPHLRMMMCCPSSLILSL